MSKVWMFRDGREMPVNDNADAVAIMEKSGWTTQAPEGWVAPPEPVNHEPISVDPVELNNLLDSNKALSAQVDELLAENERLKLDAPKRGRPKKNKEG